MDPRYPIGNYEPAPFSEALKEERLADIKFLPGLLEHAIENLDEAQLNTPYRDGGWTVRQVVHHVSDSHFEIVVVQNQQLLLFNTFDYKTPEDFIYYILFAAEQLQLNPEHFQLELLGKISESDKLYNIAYQYIRNVSLLDVSHVINPFTEAETREHFILLHS